MIIKVCGIRTTENIAELSTMGIDMVGLNFYRASVRYVDDSVLPETYDILPDNVSRVGVFVNETVDDILDKVDEYRLDYVQLHGDESLNLVQEIGRQVGIIKVCRVGPLFDMQTVAPYEFADFILFDTDSKAYGGSGQLFDWSILSSYPLAVPFLLSGGIGPRHVDAILALDHPQFMGVDINSKFESAPAVKDADLLWEFVRSIRAADGTA